MGGIKINTSDAINKIYDERKDFLIIGLTGRTGSGCSTVKDILKTTKFEKLDLRSPKDYNFKNSEERKYNKVYNYAREGNWNQFYVIEMRNIISSFIFELGYENFEEYLKRNMNIDNDECFFEGILEIKDDFNNIQEKYKLIYDKLEELNDKIIKQVDFMISKIEYESLLAHINEDFVELFLYEIPLILDKLKTVLKKHNCFNGDKESELYTYLFQTIGNNIRKSGNPYDQRFNPDKIFTISERTNSVIKAIRRVNKIRSKEQKKRFNTLICIDAIRNPYEATFFRDRYSAFYLIAINTDDHSRRTRLFLSNMKEATINSLDKIEYPKKLKGNQKFFHQNIGTCIEIADIHIYNPDVENHKYYFLTEQLLKYVMLMIHPGLITPTHIERSMQIAYNAKLNSGCLSRQVGAVVTGEDFSIKSVGWNEVPKGQISCSLRDVKQYCCNKDKESYSFYELNDKNFSETMNKINTEIDYKVLGGRLYSYCFKDLYNRLNNKNNQVYTRALHAEENAFLQISKYGGEGVIGGFLFTTASPCELCAKKAYQLGIKTIYYIDPYPGISHNHILKFGTENNPLMKLFYGAIGNAYISLYMQRISFKDELELITGKKPESIIKKDIESVKGKRYKVNNINYYKKLYSIRDRRKEQKSSDSKEL